MTEEKKNERGNTNTMYIEGKARYVKLVELPDGERKILKFSLDNVDRRGVHTFINVEIWNPNAETLTLVDTDELLLVRGSLRANEWEDKDTGNKRKTFFVNAFEILNADKSRSNRKVGDARSSGSQGSSSDQSTPRVSEPTAVKDFGGDDPFSSDSPF
jgi:single-stranded DNA-binding protein